MSKQVRYLKQIILHLEKEYGSEKAKVIMEKAEKRYNELIEENRNEPKEYYMHTRERIYPSVAVFDALLDEGIKRKDAEDFVTDYYRWRSSGMAGKIRTIFKIPGLYIIVPKLFFSMTKKMFGPQVGFKSENQYLGKDEMHFDMVKCTLIWSNALIMTNACNMAVLRLLRAFATQMIFAMVICTRKFPGTGQRP